MNPRASMGRLGPTTVKFDIGRGGGKPDLTNQDIAAAPGMVLAGPGRAGLGRELLEECWWPDGGAALRRHKLRDAVIALVTLELQRQQRRLAGARADLGLAEVCIGWGGAATAERRANRDAAQQWLGRVRAQCWPINTLESLPTLASAVIGEIAKRPHCAACEGRVQAMLGELLVPCTVCGGAGLGAVSDGRRAATIGRDEFTYRAKCRGVYEWLLQRMAEAEQEAAWALMMTLDRGNG